MREIILAVAIPMAAMSVGRVVGEQCRRQAFYSGAYQNVAMMDVAGYQSEVKHAEKDGDQQSLRKLRKNLTDARSLEADYARSRKRYIRIAASLGMPMRSDYLPPEIQPPRPTYFEPAR